METVDEYSLGSDEFESVQKNQMEGLDCPLCLKQFKSPRQLSCAHSFCEDCLHSHILKTVAKERPVKELQCPICGIVVLCPVSVSVDQWAFHFPVSTIIQLNMPSDKSSQLCDACYSEDIRNVANGFCVVCNEAMCGICMKVHRRQKISKDHTILTMDDYTSMPERIIQSSSYFKCDEHTKEDLIYFCKDHRASFCSMCAVVNRKGCLHVVELSKNVASLLREFDCKTIAGTLKKCEEQIKKSIETNMTKHSSLESQEDLVKEISDLKQKLNDALDGLEKRVRNEWERNYQVEQIKKEEQKRSFDSLLAAIKNSSLLYSVVNKYGSDTQKYLLANKLMNHLTFYTKKCNETCTLNETALLHVEINPKLKSVLTIPRGVIASLKTKRKEGNVYATEGFKPLKDCKASFKGVIEVKGLDDKEPGFIDIVFLSENRFVLLDFDNYRCCLVSLQSGQIISHYTLSCQAPISACLVADNKVAVSTCDEEQMLCVVQLFSVADDFITPVKKIALKDVCSCIAAVSQEEIVVSGSRKVGKYYWSVITLEGREKVYQEFDGHTGENSVTSMALNAFKSRLYISVHDDNSLHCFGIDGTVYFSLRPHKLGGPSCVDLDRDDNIYVVGSDSNNVFQISPDGDVLQIITEGIPATPFRIRFNTAGERFLLTNELESKLLTLFEIK